ncbi:MAG: hypothetical protein Q8J66_07430 [Methylotenera sp.]|nr:hypothetical protein [Methylotenera sp.]
MALITRRSSGWQVQIRKKGYRPISKRFDKKSEADVWARAIESEIDRNVFIDRSLAERTTLGEILIKYRDQVSINKLGYKQEKSRVYVLLTHSITNRYLATLKSSDFAEYREFRLSKVCGTTVNKELSLLAWHYNKYKKEQLYEEMVDYILAQAEAKNLRLGLWSQPNPVAPWDWRKQVRELLN